MSKPPLATHPLSSDETILRDKFAESIVNQSELMDKLAQQLITLELAIPGLYATVLKLLAGEAATLTVNGWVYASFIFWTLALSLTLFSLIPRGWTVDPTILRRDQRDQRDQNYKTGPLGIEDFFFHSAQFKRRLLIPSALCFWIGLVCAVWTVYH